MLLKNSPATEGSSSTGHHRKYFRLGKQERRGVTWIKILWNGQTEPHEKIIWLAPSHKSVLIILINFDFFLYDVHLAIIILHITPLFFYLSNFINNIFLIYSNVFLS
ncbi:hypothetical protein KSP39_PZI024083 [Platanthera zijinensis]|uniref:Uncharacterized protein n=1 Tax=Platanthera zijinensis TaxID=2320716 RepID=A0AAP0ASF1_9ASPA